MPVLTGIASILGIERTANKDQPEGYAGLNASSKVSDSELLDGVEGAAFLLKTGGTMTGQITYTDLYLNLGFQTGIDSGVGGVNAALTFYDTYYPGGVSLLDIATAISLKLSLSGGTMTGNLNLNSNAMTNISYLRTPDDLAMLIQYGTTTPSSKLMIGSGITAYANLTMSSADIMLGSNALRLDTSTTYIHINAGDMELHVGSGKKVKIVVG